jgi:hypothetical protein
VPAVSPARRGLRIARVGGCQPIVYRNGLAIEWRQCGYLVAGRESSHLDYGLGIYPVDRFAWHIIHGCQVWPEARFGHLPTRDDSSDWATRITRTLRRLSRALPKLQCQSSHRPLASRNLTLPTFARAGEHHIQDIGKSWRGLVAFQMAKKDAHKSLRAFPAIHFKTGVR